LLSGDTQESYTRTEGGLLESGGRLWPERFIILSFDEQGKVTLLDQITENDFPGLPLTWESHEPIPMNRFLIYNTIGGDPNLDFYNYMLNQKNSAN
jgi:hypothetical protein